MSIKISGITLKLYDYHETSKIVKVLTSEYGVLSLILRGANKTQSKNKSIAQPLVLGYFTIPKTEGLITCYNSEVINFYKNIKLDFEKMTYSTHIIELVLRIADDYNYNILYDLMIQSLNAIEKGIDPDIVAFSFELKILELIGIQPRLDCCVICESKQDIITFSINHGGLICKSCLSDNDYIFDIVIIKLLRYLQFTNISTIDNIEISKGNKDTLRLILNNYHDKYSGLSTKSLDILKQLGDLTDYY